MVKATKKKTGAKKTAKPAVKKKAVVKKPVAKKMATKQVLVKKKVAKKTVAKKAVAKKVATKKVVVRKAVVKKPAAKKKVAKKIVAKKPGAKKAAVKKIAVKAPVLKKPAPVTKKKIKKGEATLAIDLDTASEDEIDAAIDTIVDAELGEEHAFGDEIEFADDDSELDEEEAAPITTMPVAAVGGFPEQMRDAALKVLDERQAEDIVSIPLAGRSSLADYVIIASGRAARQVSALADYLRETFAKLGVKHVRIEGLGESNWVLVDAGDVIVHLFRPEVRSYYDVDSIWAAKHPK